MKEVVQQAVDGALQRVKNAKGSRPFHEALLTPRLLNAAIFERSFSTAFGQHTVETISEIIAKSKGCEAQRQKRTLANVYKGAIDEIERIRSQLRGGERKPNWDQEVRRVTAYCKGDTEVRQVISDLWINCPNQPERFVSIKTVKPNLDQTEIAKRDMLLLKAHDPSYEPYLALYYNPGGVNRSDYNWSVPSKIFDMHGDPCVLIGEDYWDLIGGSGTYETLLEVFAEVGHTTQQELEHY